MRIPYVREAGAVLALTVLVAGGIWLYRAGGTQARLDCAKIENAQLKAQRAETERWQKIANDTDEKLQRVLKAQPSTGSKVERAVHDHPTRPDCVVPDAVADELQNGIRAGAANAAP